MAIRPFFISSCDDNFYIEKTCEFQYFSGFAISQKKKSVESLHKKIQELIPNAKILEVSTKSDSPLGYQLSAFNLQYKFPNAQSYPLESVFQSSKVFENEVQYKDLLYLTPKQAKTDERIRNSGKLIYFTLNGIKWDLEPKTAFYDYTYISALMNNPTLCQQLMQYDTFTDIEFNPKRSLNCQARSVAIYVSLQKMNKVNEYMQSKEHFLKIYKKNIGTETQLSFFDK